MTTLSAPGLSWDDVLAPPAERLPIGVPVFIGAPNVDP